jgi:hypothetical protein
MTSRWLTGKKLWVLGAFVAGYILLWFLTHFVGMPSVYHAVIGGMPATSSFAYTDVPRRVRTTGDDPIYFCRAVAYAPFLVRADYGWRSGRSAAEGGSALYIWFFGRSFRVRELEHWRS